MDVAPVLMDDGVDRAVNHRPDYNWQPEELPTRICVHERAVQHVGVPIKVLNIKRCLYIRIRAEETLEVWVIKPAIHIN